MFSIKPFPVTASVDGCGHAGNLLTDLLKSIDFIDHKLLIAKLYTVFIDVTTFHSFVFAPIKTKSQKKFFLQNVCSDFIQFT